MSCDHTASLIQGYSLDTPSISLTLIHILTFMPSMLDSTSIPCPMHHCHFHWLTAHSAFCPKDEGNMIPQSVGNNLPSVVA